jgi:hypothetical protein
LSVTSAIEYEFKFNCDISLEFLLCSWLWRLIMCFSYVILSWDMILIALVPDFLRVWWWVNMVNRNRLSFHFASTDISLNPIYKEKWKMYRGPKRL